MKAKDLIKGKPCGWCWIFASVVFVTLWVILVKLCEVWV